MLSASSAGMTASRRTLQNKAIFSRSLSGSSRSQRQTMISGWMPSEVSSRTLCWVGLVFNSPAAAMKGTSVVWIETRACRAADLVAELADRLDEGQQFDVADGAADLAQDEVAFRLDVGADEVLDRVGDVGDDLDGGAEIVAAALAGDDALVDPARGDVVRLAGGNAGEALVMAEVEVGLGAVVGDVDLAMLVGRHRARIDVEIGIELPQADLVAARLEERRERRRHQALAKR